MPRSRKASIVDGYATLSAARRALEKKPKSKPPATKGKDPGTPRKPSASRRKAGAKAHFGRTAMPSRQEIRCYECGYVFTVTGAATKVACPKCREILDRSDWTIEEEWNDVVKTSGTVHIKPSGTILGGTIAAHSVIVEGKIRAGSVEAFQCMELRAGAEFPEAGLKAVDLRIGAGARITFTDTVRYRNVEVHGALTATLYATGVVRIQAGGLLKGEVHCAHLNVDDGGILEAGIFLDSEPMEDRT